MAKKESRQTPNYELLKQKDDESLVDWYKRLFRDVRSKTDLKDWTGCPPFHLDNKNQ